MCLVVEKGIIILGAASPKSLIVLEENNILVTVAFLQAPGDELQCLQSILL